MSNGKTHDKINNFSLLILLLIAIFFSVFSVSFSVVFTICFLFSTYFLSPDLDIRSNSYHRWGCLRFIWKPYQKMNHHRSFYTHFPLISDVIRLLYIGCAIVLFGGVYWLLITQLQKIEWHMYLVALLLFGGIIYLFLQFFRKSHYKGKVMDSLVLILLVFLWQQLNHQAEWFLWFQQTENQETLFWWSVICIFATSTSTCIHFVTDIIYSAQKRRKKSNTKQNKRKSPTR